VDGDLDFTAAGLPAGRYLFTVSYGGCTPGYDFVDVVAGEFTFPTIPIDC
jgi:hypothetical protein